VDTTLTDIDRHVTVKFVELTPGPTAFLTLIVPVVAPAGTVAVIWVSESTVNLATVPLNVTRVAPVKFVPVIVTAVPTGPEVGVKPEMIGLVIVNAGVLAIPPGVVTPMGPVVAPVGAVAVIWVSELTVNFAAVPLNLTAVVPMNPDPVIVTTVPTGPADGVSPEIAGTGDAVTVKADALAAAPPAFLTLISPVVAREGTVAVIWVSELTVNFAVMPLNVTVVAPVRFVPVIVTAVPTGPEVGEKSEIVGLVTAKLDALVAVPPDVVTLIGPVVAPGGTLVAIDVSLVTVNDEAFPLNFTPVVPVKAVPVMATLVPTGPDVGVNEEIAGGEDAVTMKLDALVAVPPGVATLIGPVVAPGGTLVAIDVSLVTVNAAGMPLNVTELAPARSVPVIVTGSPRPPLDGSNPQSPGRGEEDTNMKSEPLVAAPPRVVTPIGPDVAQGGTVATTDVSPVTENAAGRPSNVTEVVPMRAVPLMVTDSPGPPPAGSKPVIVGAGATGRGAMGKGVAVAAAPRRGNP
jgi:hypothetical protein